MTAPKSPRLTVNDYSDGSHAVENADYYEAAPDFNIYSWSPAPPGTLDAQSTQVHMHIGSIPGPIIVVRMKSASAVDALIEALQIHRANVFGKI